MDQKSQVSQQQDKIKQKLVRHIENRQKIRKIYADKGIQMLDKQDLLIQDIQDPILNANQNDIYNAMQNELSQNGYSHFRFLGQGAQGLVVLAKDQLTNKRFAIKGIQIKDSKGNVDQQAVKQVNQEINLLNECKGLPYVVNFVGKIEGQQFVYLVLTECLGTLNQIIQKSPDKKLNELSAIKYAKDIAEGLYFIHSKKCLVNDLKMDNILIDYNGNAVISDFGLADNLPKQSGYTLNLCMGNVAYQAPECYDPQHYDTYFLEYQNLGIVVKREPSQRSEACSLGYLIYSMISGFNNSVLFNKHNPLPYKPEFQNFTYKKQLQYIIDGLTQFIPRNRFEIKDVLIILKGIISFEFSLDSRFFELVETEEEEEEESLQQLIKKFKNEIELVQQFENKFYPVIKNEQNLLQQLDSKQSQQVSVIEELNQKIKSLNETIQQLQNENKQYQNYSSNNQHFVQNKQAYSNQVFNQQVSTQPTSSQKDNQLKQEPGEKKEIQLFQQNQISEQNVSQQKIQSNKKQGYVYDYYGRVLNEQKDKFIGCIKKQDIEKGDRILILWQNFFWKKRIGRVSLINGEKIYQYNKNLSEEDNFKQLIKPNCEYELF